MIRIVAPVVAALIATAPTARAQTWRWHYVLRVPNGPPVNAQSTVQVAGDHISLTYSATIRRRDVVIASCRAALQDVDRASAFRSEGRVFFLVRLRADRAAACDSGPKAAAAVPGSDFAELSRIADAVNRALPPPAVASRNGPTHSLPAGSDASPAVVPDVPARLVTRGTSELAIGHAGVARVRVTVAADGTPQDASILSVSDRRLAAAAIATAVASTYAPATKDGKPVAAPYVGTFTFTGEDPATAAIPIWRRSPLPAPLPTETPTPAPTPTATATPTATPSPTPVPTPMPTVRPRRTPDTLEPIRWFPSRRSTPRPTPTPTPVPTPTATATPTPLPPAPAASAPASGAR